MSDPFNPDNFLGTPIEGVGDTSFPTIEKGTWVFVIDDVKVNVFKDKNNPGQDNQRWINLELQCTSSDPNLLEAMGRDKPVSARFRVLTEIENGTIRLGKGINGDLSRLREALGQNTPAPWSPSMMRGNMLKITVDHERSNKPGDDREFPRAKAFYHVDTVVG